MAFLISVNSYSVVSIFSPLTHQILGLLKVSLSIVAGTILFGNSIEIFQFIGAVVALIGIGWYTVVTVEENRIAKTRPKYGVEERA